MMTTSATPLRKRHSVDAIERVLSGDALDSDEVQSAKELYRRFAGAIEFYRQVLNRSWGDIAAMLATSEPPLLIDKRTLSNYRCEFMSVESNRKAAQAEVERLLAQRQARRAARASAPVISPPTVVADSPAPVIRSEFSSALPIPTPPPMSVEEAPSFSEAAQSAPAKGPSGDDVEWRNIVAAIRQNADATPRPSVLIYENADGKRRKEMVSVQIQDLVLKEEVTTLEQFTRQLALARGR